jgi:23S rRNA (cytidine1920-2'-O)/16S rRNA (cytidine1409-2'-O)-methyltransferase
LSSLFRAILAEAKPPFVLYFGYETTTHALVELGHAPDLRHANTLIMTGHALVNEHPVTKAGTLVNLAKDTLRIKGEQCPYVSRGGIKLAHAMEAFSLDCSDAIALDVGASTGGFTDCLLQHGARHVYAVDVGTNQLHHHLKMDARVTSWENTNGRTLTPEQFPNDQRPSIGVTDVSFISLKKILPALCECLNVTQDTSWVVALLKPQFECLDYFSHEEAAAFDGVIREPAQRERVKDAVLKDLALMLDAWTLEGVEESPIKGPKGNVEYLTLWRPL